MNLSPQSYSRVKTSGVAVVALSSLIALSPLPAQATVRDARSYQLQQAPDGMLPAAFPDAVWQKGLMGSDFFDVTTRVPSRFSTRSYVLYDAENVYVRFECDQKDVPVTALQSTNDVGFGTDDFVGVGIDTSGNGSQVYYFETTPAAVRYQAASENARYQPRWTSSAHLTPDGWEAVLSIPLSAMRLHPGNQQSWRMNFIRGVVGKAEHLSWAWNGLMTDAVGSAWPMFTDAQYWPDVQVAIASRSQVVRAKPHAEIFGLASAGGDSHLFQQANGTFLTEPDRFVGADVSVPLTNTINFVGTVDPDFSNVEIDQATIAPTEFARLLTEYRPFFTQGAPFLNPNLMQSGPAGTPNNAIFNSPSVGPFNSGQKLEGSFGDQAFGVMHFAGQSEVTDSDFRDVAFGYLHALPDQSFRYWSDGVLAHDSLAGSDTTAEVGASAMNLKSGVNGGIDQAWEAGSYVPDLHRAQDLDTFVGVTKPNYAYAVVYQDIAPDYNPSLGFTTISDIHGALTYLMTDWSLPWTKSVRTLTGVDRFFDDSGSVHQADAFSKEVFTLKDQLSVGIAYHAAFTRSYATQAPSRSQTCASPDIARTSFSGYPNYYCPLTQPFSTVGLTLGYRDGTPFPIDASFSEGPFGGAYLHQYGESFSRQINRRLSLSMDYDGTDASSGGTLTSQWLRRFSVSEALSADSNVSLEYRAINGSIAVVPQPPGSNLAVSFRHLLRNGNSLYLSYGTAAASQTLNRFIVKYIFSSGGGAGT